MFLSLAASAWTEAIVYGDLSEIPKLEKVLHDAGHHFEIYTKTPLQVKKRLVEVVLQEKMQSLKKMNQTMSKQDKLTYLEKWEALNLEMLEEVGRGMSCREDNSGSTNQDKKRSVKCQVFHCYCVMFCL
jgi:hypothetical protein